MTIDEVEVNKMRGVLCDIHNGYTCIYSCINYNLILSDNAKLLYLTLAQHCYGEKRDCHPSQERIALMLGMSRQRVIDSSAELVRYGIIKTKKPNNCNTVYTLKEVHNIPVVIHSDILWRIYLEIENEGINYNDYYKALKKYKMSALYQEVLQYNNPRKYTTEIQEYFNKILGISEKGEEQNMDERAMFIIDEGKAEKAMICHKYFYSKYERKYGIKLTISEETWDTESNLMMHAINTVFLGYGEEDSRLFANFIIKKIDIYLDTKLAGQISIIDFCKGVLKENLEDSYHSYMKCYDLN